tara:strand:- start:1824 stop:2018 length:195 start_codon:yes stop_codon:yes gene_type:complete
MSTQEQFRSRPSTRIFCGQLFSAQAMLLNDYFNFALKKVSQKDGQVVRADGVRSLMIVLLVNLG